MVMLTIPCPAAVGRVTEQPDVVVIVVTFNSADVVETFLNAMPAALEGVNSAQVIIVDNESSDGTPAKVRQMAPWVVVLESGGNLGYAAGINIGMRHLNATRGFMVLNPDAVPRAGCIRRLMNAVESDDSLGISVPKIVDTEGTLSYSLRREPSIGRALGEALLGGRRAARYGPLSEMIRDPSYYVDRAKADWATGAAMYIARKVVDAIGSWPEEYFLYSEETAYALGARDAGYNLQLVADAVVVHRGGEMTTSPMLWSLQAVNRIRLYRSRHGRVASGFYWCAVTLNEAIRSVRRKPTHRAAVVALFRDASPRRLDSKNKRLVHQRSD
ncbi:glycosyltransferase family 2 protein [Phytoactinopolyspora alkaliphila]|uniref:Glycosyltransferase family 2 protein n=1 Tax=Phytoactinopolyspora alkaliphila TaxID=1783498 RepID=A0A6N9YJD0_9ACTN|nr:glycosyltransferase family 2 protein [Phytoactinopolyspora alkaliphila]NED95093.1 glycosyltransferase family 2 protein [Phytoactinopolyspora alkaliphila]